MADESTPAALPSRQGRALPIVVVTILMLGEGIGIYLLAEALHAQPEEAVAGPGDAGRTDGGATDLAGTDEALSEVELAECRPNNRMSGKFISLHVRVEASVPTSELERAKAMIKARQARIRDRVNFVIRSAELKHLNEPGLETIRRRFKHELDRVFSDEKLIREVLITEWQQSSSGV